MPKVTANGISLEYDTFGNQNDRPLLLIIGLGGQLFHWDEDLCLNLASRGHYVIRYDNRDSGLSTKFHQDVDPNILEALGKILNGDKSVAPYTIEDMADDGAGLLDALGIRAAHICGMSMGGMIAQTIALRHPGSVLSLTSIYSTTGNPQLPPPKPEVMSVLLAPRIAEKSAYVEQMLAVFQMIAGPGFPFDVEWTRRMAAQSFDRSFCPLGEARQLMAILAQINRKPALSSLRIPTLVIHGTDDPLVPLECGKDTAEAIPNSELIIIEGMGHDLPHGGAWLRIVEALSAHTLKASAR